MAKKTTCPITRSQFREKARPVTVMINDQKLVADPKEFSTDSLGWYLPDHAGYAASAQNLMGRGYLL